MSTQPTQLPVPSESPRDLKFNAGKIDEFVTSLAHEYSDRFGTAHLTMEGIRWLAQQAMASYGYITVDSFQDGATLTLPNQVLRDTSTGEYYRWDGKLPKSVPSGSSPSSSGGVGYGAWLSVGDASLRAALSKSDGASLIGIGSSDLQTEVTRFILAGRNAKYLGQAYKKLKSYAQLKIICVGDSLTAGYDVNSPDKVAADNGDYATHAPMQYPKAMNNILGIFTGVSHTVVNRGYSGDTAKACYNRWGQIAGDVAHIMLGTNDAAGASGATFEEYMQYMELLIQRYITWGMGVVIHTATPQRFGSMNDEASKYTAAAAKMARQYSCPVFESDTSVQYAMYDGVYSDNVHFNAHGYNKYGNAVAAFIIAGGWVREPKMVKGEIHLQPKRGYEGIGYVETGVTSDFTTGSYLTNRAVVGFNKVGDRLSYTFFMDTEFAEIHAVGSLSGLNFELSYQLGAQYSGDVRGAASVNRTTIKSYRALSVAENTNYISPGGRTAQKGKDTYIGALVGRGWKTVSISAPTGFTGTSYFNGIIIREKGIDEITATPVLNSLVVKPVTPEAYAIQIPYSKDTDSSASAPAAQSLPASVYFPLPKSLYPYTGNLTQWYDNLPVELLITMSTGWQKVLAYKVNGSDGTTLSVQAVSGNLASLIPTSMTIVSKAFSESAGGPDGDFVAGFGSETSSLYLKVNFGSTPSSYYSLLLTSYGKSGVATMGR